MGASCRDHDCADPLGVVMVSRSTEWARSYWGPALYGRTQVRAGSSMYASRRTQQACGDPRISVLVSRLHRVGGRWSVFRAARSSTPQHCMRQSAKIEQRAESGVVTIRELAGPTRPRPRCGCVVHATGWGIGGESCLGRVLALRQHAARGRGLVSPFLIHRIPSRGTQRPTPLRVQRFLALVVVISLLYLP